MDIWCDYVINKLFDDVVYNVIDMWCNGAINICIWYNMTRDDVMDLVCNQYIAWWICDLIDVWCNDVVRAWCDWHRGAMM